MSANQYIYKVTNLLNGKVYVGQHDGSKPHYYASGVVLKRAIKKYGRDNFRREIIIEGIFSKEELDALEVFYIAELKTYAYEYPDGGYNYTRGGKGKRGHQPTEASRAAMRMNSAYRKEVVQLTKSGEYVKTYRSVTEAAESMGVHHTNISRSCAGFTTVCAGFRWMWATDHANALALPPEKTNKKAVAQFDLTGQQVAVFASASEAATATGANRAGIANVLCGNAKTAAGFFWAFVKQ